MSRRLCNLCFVLMVSIYGIQAQETLPELTSKDSIVSSSWIAGLGINIVDDSGGGFGGVTDINDKWNIVPFPSRLSIGRYFSNGLGLELIGTYNNYKEGNIIDGQVNPEDITYWAVDSRLSYDLNKLFGETGLFDPYLGAGLGYTDANNEPRGTYNAVVGFRLWLSDQWGLDLNSSGKWSFTNDASNHIQHAAGVVYRFNMEKGLSNKGREKLALREAMMAEQQRVQDSIQAAQEAEERARQQALEEERRRQEALAAAEAARQQEAAAAQQAALTQELGSLGTITYDLDSSYLTPEAKETLRRIADFLQRNDSISLSIIGHTNSLGAAKYNQWLSERRARRAYDFLVEEGISASRLSYAGMGESQLLNHCSDGVKCTAEEHGMNRRVELRAKF